MYKRIVRHSLVFKFESNEIADKFYNIACTYADCALIEHPDMEDSSGKPMINMVYVKGTGSNLYDSTMKVELLQVANRLGGELVKELHQGLLDDL